MREWVVALLIVLGASIMLLGAVGVVRMPDLFTRMQTATKPGILGSGLLAIAVSLHFLDLWVTMRALLIGGFFLLTAPVAAHAIARSAYLSGIELWPKSVVDELKGRYDEKTGRLDS